MLESAPSPREHGEPALSRLRWERCMALHAAIGAKFPALRWLPGRRRSSGIGAGG